MKNAYNQGLECDHGDDEGGDDGVSPKDVGHNIYILAHQVSHFISLHYFAHSINRVLYPWLVAIFSSSGPFIYSALTPRFGLKRECPKCLTMHLKVC